MRWTFPALLLFLLPSCSATGPRDAGSPPDERMDAGVDAGTACVRPDPRDEWWMVCPDEGGGWVLEDAPACLATAEMPAAVVRAPALVPDNEDQVTVQRETSALVSLVQPDELHLSSENGDVTWIVTYDIAATGRATGGPIVGDHVTVMEFADLVEPVVGDMPGPCWVTDVLGSNGLIVSVYEGRVPCKPAELEPLFFDFVYGPRCSVPQPEAADCCPFYVRDSVRVRDDVGTVLDYGEWSVVTIGGRPYVVWAQRRLYDCGPYASDCGAYSGRGLAVVLPEE